MWKCMENYFDAFQVLIELGITQKQETHTDVIMSSSYQQCSIWYIVVFVVLKDNLQLNSGFTLLGVKLFHNTRQYLNNSKSSQ